MTAVVVGVLVASALLAWPGRAGIPTRSRNRSPGTSLWTSSGVSDRLRPWRAAARRRAARGVEAEVLSLLDGLVPALRAGLPPAAAMRAALPVSSTGPPPPGLAELVQMADRGERLGPTWRRLAGATGSDDVATVAAAWTLCDTLGSPLATTLSTVAQSVRERRTVLRRMDAALAGPRATMRVLTGLPLVGPLLGWAVGVPPTELYATAPAMVALVAGLVLLLLGRWWAARLILSAAGEARQRGRAL